MIRPGDNVRLRAEASAPLTAGPLSREVYGDGVGVVMWADLEVGVDRLARVRWSTGHGSLVLARALVVLPPTEPLERPIAWTAEERRAWLDTLEAGSPVAVRQTMMGHGAIRYDVVQRRTAREIVVLGERYSLSTGHRLGAGNGGAVEREEWLEP